jgi:hypothetical protein
MLKGIIKASVGALTSDPKEEQAMTDTTTHPPELADGQPYIIDPEFQNLFDTKAAEDYESLKEAIRIDGKVRDPLVVWDETGILADGHTRHRIYEELREELQENFRIEPPTIIRMPFASREEVMMWMVQNQLARRNLNSFQRIEAALRYKNFFAEMARKNQHAGVSPNLGKGIETNEEVAKLSGVKSSETVRKVVEILKVADKPKVAKAIKALRRGEGGFSIHGVYEEHCPKKKKADPPAPSLPPPATHEASDDAPVCNRQIDDILGTTSEQIDDEPDEHVSEADTLTEASEEQPQTVAERFDAMLNSIGNIIIEDYPLQEDRLLCHDMLIEWANTGKENELSQTSE